jgi:hypothetical protein
MHVELFNLTIACMQIDKKKINVNIAYVLKCIKNGLEYYNVKWDIFWQRIEMET